MDDIMRRLVVAFYAAIIAFFGLTSADVYGKPKAESIPHIALKYQAMLIREARFVFGLEAPTATFGAQIESESGWRPGARNSSGAAGLGQFIPSTARFMAKRYADLSPVAPLNPQWAIRALLRYDKILLAMTREGTRCERARRWLAGYNAGPSRMYKRWPRETQRYVTKVLNVLEPRYTANGWGLGSCN